jgi:glutamine amidotransferase
LVDPVLHTPHSLLVQSYAPKDMRGGGTVNADGFGIGWFGDDGCPTRYRRSYPLWSDSAMSRLLAPVRAGAFLAAVRSGTPGMPVTETACAPFADDDWLFSHNGVVFGWPESVSGLAESIPVVDLLRLEVPTDSALLWLLLRHALRSGTDPVRALAELTHRVEAAAPGSRLNFLLVGKEVLVATAWTHTLSVRRFGEGVLVASEPCDDHADWRPVADGELVVARLHGPRGHAVDGAGAATFQIVPLEQERSQT